MELIRQITLTGITVFLFSALTHAVAHEGSIWLRVTRPAGIVGLACAFVGVLALIWEVL